MHDIVERLRDPVNNWNSGLRFVAADEIERLRVLLVEASRTARDVGFNDALEEAAKVAERELSAELGKEIADIIRALKEKVTDA